MTRKCSWPPCGAELPDAPIRVDHVGHARWAKDKKFNYVLVRGPEGERDVYRRRKAP